MLALQWRSVDLEAGTITIDGTLCRYGQTRTEPKTASGRRTIAISHAVVTALAAHQASQRKASPEGYVFTSRFGTPLAAKTPADHLRRVLAALGLPHVVWHDLRHTVATMMLASGVPLQLVSKILGHASVQITADLYNYIPPEATREAAEALERVLS
jgi:integrase